MISVYSVSSAMCLVVILIDMSVFPCINAVNAYCNLLKVGLLQIQLREEREYARAIAFQLFFYF